MNARDLSFVIPTYRLRDVGETVEQYDQHFWKNGHAITLIVFDDSSPANQQKYLELLERTRTHNDLYYVGPQEKEQRRSILRNSCISNIRSRLCLTPLDRSSSTWARSGGATRSNFWPGRAGCCFRLTGPNRLVSS
jgi:hypothetical protein